MKITVNAMSKVENMKAKRWSSDMPLPAYAWVGEPLPGRGQYVPVREWPGPLYWVGRHSMLLTTAATSERGNRILLARDARLTGSEVSNG